MSLFPPIVASSMPAFDINNTNTNVKIYFTPSNYNTIDDVKEVHVTVRRQSSNVIVSNGYEGILIKTDIGQTAEDKALNRYYISIVNEEDVNFEANVLYKVQLRFSQITTTQQSLIKNETLSKFSEWSTVCIIKPINAPNFYISDFQQDGQNISTTDINNYYSEIPDFLGVYYPNDGQEVLNSWRMRLLDPDYELNADLDITNYTLADSGWNLVSAYNYTPDSNGVIFQGKLQYELIEREFYKLLFEIKTNNDYQGSKLYNFYYYPIDIDALDGTLKTYVNEEEGYIKVQYTSETQLSGNITLRRSDSKGNFLNWQDLKTFEGKENGDTNFSYYDFTAESGIAYRYLVQKRDSRGRRGQALYDQVSQSQSPDESGKGTVAEWEHAYLLESSLSPFDKDLTIKQLKLKFDHQISSWKINISESRTDTIGSKYPFIRQNGNMYYRSFPFTGTITAYMDSANLFTSKDSLNDGYTGIYQEYKGDDLKYDYTYERKFREAVEAFLYNPNPKLYKSRQEGNVLIKLMQVSLTPKNELDRLIYTFSATAYEIAEPNILNFNKYGIIDIGSYNPHIQRLNDNTYGHIDSYIDEDHLHSINFRNDQDIIGTDKPTSASENSIAKKYHLDEVFEGNKVTDISLSWIRIEVQSDPYLIEWEWDNDNKKGKYRPFMPYNLGQPIDYLYRFEEAFFKGDAETVRIGIEQPNPGAAAATASSPEGWIIHSPETYNYLDWIDQKVIAENYRPVYLGTLLQVVTEEGTEQIIIGAPPNNIYEMDGDIKSLVVRCPTSDNDVVPEAQGVSLRIDFMADISYQIGANSNPRKIRAEERIGQLIGPFDPTSNLITKIQEKYYDVYYLGDGKDNKVNQYIQGVTSISIDGAPNSIVAIKTNQDDPSVAASTMIVNHTGELTLDPHNSDVRITEFYVIDDQDETPLVNYFVNVRRDYY